MAESLAREGRPEGAEKHRGVAAAPGRLPAGFILDPIEKTADPSQPPPDAGTPALTGKFTSTR